MKTAMIALALFGLAAPVLAQGVDPALEAEGSQVQSVEILDGAVSVEVDTSGSASAGRGEDQLDGSLGITVNDQPLISRGSAGGDPPASSAADSRGTVGSGAAASQHSPRATTGAAVSGTGIDQPACLSVVSASAEDLKLALDHGAEILLRPVTCPAVDMDAADLLASDPRLVEAAAAWKLTHDNVVAITIDNGTVIIAHGTRA